MNDHRNIDCLIAYHALAKNGLIRVGLNARETIGGLSVDPLVAGSGACSVRPREVSALAGPGHALRNGMTLVYYTIDR